MQGSHNVGLGLLTVITGSASSAVVLAVRLLHGLSGGTEVRHVVADWPTAPGEKHPLRAMTGPNTQASFGYTVAESYPIENSPFGNNHHDYYELRIKIDVRGVPQIVGEKLTGPAPAYKSGEVANRTLLRRVNRSTVFPYTSSVAEIYGGYRGTRPHHQFSSSGLLTPELVRPGDNRKIDNLDIDNVSHQAVVKAADLVVSALENIIVLNPSVDDVRRRGEGSTPRLYPSGAGTLDVLVYLRSVAPKAYEVVQKATCPWASDASEFFDWASCVSGPAARFLAVATALVAPVECFATGIANMSKVKPDTIFIVVDDLLRGAPWKHKSVVLPLLQLCAQTRDKQILLTTADPDFLPIARDISGQWLVRNLD